MMTFYCLGIGSWLHLRFNFVEKARECARVARMFLWALVRDWDDVARRRRQDCRHDHMFRDWIENKDGRYLP